MNRDHSWSLDPTQVAGSIRQICDACGGRAETKLTGRGSITEYRAPFGTPITTRSMAGLPACRGAAADSPPPAVAREAKG